MKKNTRIAVLLVFAACSLGQQALSHAQHVHQYLTIEGYNLLRQQIGVDIPALQARLGGIDPFYAGDRAWQRNYVTTGAWREDEEDVVWWYSKTNPPTITGLAGVLTQFIALFGGLPGEDAFVSSTHFFDADNGDGISTDLEGTYAGLNWRFTVPNSYQKIQKYAYPNRSWVMKYYDGNAGHVSTFAVAGGGQITYTWYSYLGFEYNTLSELYTTGRAWIVGYYDSQGQWIDHNVRPDILPREVVLGAGWRDTFYWEILGRMCHLVQDLSVPAHAHRDAHGKDHDGIRQDSYETWVGGPSYPYTHWNHANVGSMLLPPSGNPLHFLMYTTQQISDHFGSNGPYEGDGNDILGGDPLIEELQYLNSINISTLGAPTGMAGPFDVSRLTNIRDKTLPQAIRATAGLLYWFAVEANLFQIPSYQIVVKNDFEAGTVSVNSQSNPSGTGFSFTAGTFFTVGNTTPQNHAGYIRHFDKWRKLNPDGSMAASNAGISWPTVANGNHTYNAAFNKEFNVNIQTAHFVEPGIGGGYSINGGPVDSSWSGTFVERVSSPITVRAVPPAGWVFLRWSDGVLGDQRTIIPTDHITLRAWFKKPLASTTISATGSNGQRKMVALKTASSSSQDAYHLVYESGGEIFLATSDDGGNSWFNEVLLSNGAGGCSAPSITGWVEPTMDQPGNSELYVVYRRLNGEGYDICLKTLKNGTPLPTVILNSVDPVPAGANPHPVAGIVRPSLLLVAWEDGAGYTTVEGTPIEDFPYWENPSMRNYSGDFHTPSVSGAVFGTGLTPQGYLALEFEQSIITRSSEDATFRTAPASLLQPPSVPQLAVDVLHESLCNIGYNPVHIMWESIRDAKEVPPATDAGGTWPEAEEEPGSGDSRARPRSVIYQPLLCFAEDVWDEAHEFVNGSPGKSFYRPSVTYLESGHVLAAWDDGARSYSARYEGNSWTYTQQYASSAHANYVTNGTSGLLHEARFVFTSSSGPPHSLGFSSPTAEHPEVEEEYEREVGAGVAVAEPAAHGNEVSKACFSLGLSRIGFKLTNGSIQRLDFVPSKSDTMPSITENNAWDKLSSTSITLPSSVDSIIIRGTTRLLSPGRILGSGQSSLRLAFDLVDANTGKIIRRVGNERVYERDTVNSIGIRGRVRDLTGRTIFLRTTVLGLARGRSDIKYSLKHVHRLTFDTTDAPVHKPMARLEEANGLPAIYAVHQNYPNPFNPVTVFNYELPEATSVSLVVYDVLGREVTTLASGQHEPGYHSVNWDASAVSSGVYFARFTATDAVGQMKLSRILKLALVK